MLDSARPPTPWTMSRPCRVSYCCSRATTNAHRILRHSHSCTQHTQAQERCCRQLAQPRYSQLTAMPTTASTCMPARRNTLSGVGQTTATPKSEGTEYSALPSADRMCTQISKRITSGSFKTVGKPDSTTLLSLPPTATTVPTAQPESCATITGNTNTSTWQLPCLVHDAC